MDIQTKTKMLQWVFMIFAPVQWLEEVLFSGRLSGMFLTQYLKNFFREFVELLHIQLKDEQHLTPYRW